MKRPKADERNKKGKKKRTIGIRVRESDPVVEEVAVTPTGKIRLRLEAKSKEAKKEVVSEAGSEVARAVMEASAPLSEVGLEVGLEEEKKGHPVGHVRQENEPIIQPDSRIEAREKAASTALEHFRRSEAFIKQMILFDTWTSTAIPKDDCVLTIYRTAYEMADSATLAVDPVEIQLLKWAGMDEYSRKLNVTLQNKASYVAWKENLGRLDAVTGNLVKGMSMDYTKLAQDIKEVLKLKVELKQRIQSTSSLLTLQHIVKAFSAIVDALNYRYAYYTLSVPSTLIDVTKVTAPFKEFLDKTRGNVDFPNLSANTELIDRLLLMYRALVPINRWPKTLDFIGKIEILISCYNRLKQSNFAIEVNNSSRNTTIHYTDKLKRFFLLSIDYQNRKPFLKKSWEELVGVPYLTEKDLTLQQKNFKTYMDTGRVNAALFWDPLKRGEDGSIELYFRTAAERAKREYDREVIKQQDELLKAQERFRTNATHENKTAVVEHEFRLVQAAKIKSDDIDAELQPIDDISVMLRSFVKDVRHDGSYKRLMRYLVMRAKGEKEYLNDINFAAAYDIGTIAGRLMRMIAPHLHRHLLAAYDNPREPNMSIRTKAFYQQLSLYYINMRVLLDSNELQSDLSGIISAFMRNYVENYKLHKGALYFKYILVKPFKGWERRRDLNHQTLPENIASNSLARKYTINLDVQRLIETNFSATNILAQLYERGASVLSSTYFDGSDSALVTRVESERLISPDDKILLTTISLEYPDYELYLPKIAYYSALSTNVRRLKQIVLKNSYAPAFLCVYELYLNAKYGLPKVCNRFTLDAWLKQVAEEFAQEESAFKEILASGDIEGILLYIYIFKDLNICVFDYVEQVFLCYSGDIDVLPTCGVLCKKHMYTSSIDKILATRYSKDWEEGTLAKYTLAEKIHWTNDHQLQPIFKQRGDYVAKPIAQAESDSEEEDKSKIEHVHLAFDIETYKKDESGEQIPFLICIGDLNSRVYSSYYGADCIVNFVLQFLLPLIQEAKTSKHKSWHIWSYNGSRFDNHLIIDTIERLVEVKITGTELKLKTFSIGAKIEFLDLALWYSVPPRANALGVVEKGLQALATYCGVKGKSSFDVQSLSYSDTLSAEFRTKSIAYCENDVRVVLDLIPKLVIETYQEFKHNNIKPCIGYRFPCSGAALSMKLFQSCFNKEHLEAFKLSIYEQERASYRGGLVIALMPHAKNIRVFDINSSYPFVMLGDLPVYLIGEYVGGVDYDRSNKHELHDLGLYRVRGFQFPPDVILPNLMVKTSKGIILPRMWRKSVGPEYVYAWGHELALAVDLGAIVSTESYIHYEGAKCFKEFVEYFYPKKVAAKQNGQAHLELFYKNVLNSLQGKFGLKFHPAFSIDTFGRLGQEAHVRAAETIKYLGKDFAKVTWETGDKETSQIGGLVRIPSYIAAKGRTNILRAAYSVLPNGRKAIDYVAYIDTDSLFMKDRMSLPIEYLSDTELGKFKEEVKKNSDEAYFFGAKNYVLFNQEAGTVVCKGAREIKASDYVAAMLGTGEYTSEISPFFISSFDSVRVTTCFRTLRPTFELKRRITGPESSEPYDSIEESERIQLLAVAKRGNSTKMYKKDKEIKALLPQALASSPNLGAIERINARLSLTMYQKYVEVLKNLYEEYAINKPEAYKQYSTQLSMNLLLKDQLDEKERDNWLLKLMSALN